VYLLVFHAYINEMHSARSKIPSKKSRPYIYDVKFMALLGAPYVYDISGLRAKEVKYFLTEGILLLFYNNLIVTPYNCATDPSKLWISIYLGCQLSLMLWSHNWQNWLSKLSLLCRYEGGSFGQQTLNLGEIAFLYSLKGL
jgi:hypothetical protein